jgi:beta-lactamase regulating signal transducer with metallopeptidase domain
MNAASQFARVWFDWAIAASWQLALLIGLIAALVYALRDASPRLRYGLWLLVLLKALLPPTLGAFRAVGAWGVAPVVNFSWSNGSAGTHESPLVREQRKAIDNDAAAAEVLAIRNTAYEEGPFAVFLTESPLLLIWAAGCLSLLSVVAWRYRRITRMTDSMCRIEEGPVSVELQRLVDLFSVRRTPNLYTTKQAISPMLFGVLTPKIVLPQPILDRLNPQELRMVLAHELVHWRRRDTWVGWLQVVVQCVY